MVRLLYSFFLSLCLPFLLLRLLWLSRQNKGHRAHLLERLGYYKKTPDPFRRAATIWLHTVSVGETQAIAPLLALLAKTYPEHGFVLTHTTPTGRVTLQKEFDALLGPRLQRLYLPYDLVFFIRRFLNRFTPCISILVETEIWPNLLFICGKKNIPTALINARLSPRSHKKALRLPALFKPAAQQLSLICAQTPADAERLAHWTSKTIYLTGNLKFDYQADPAIQAQGQAWKTLTAPRKVICLASSREDEEEMLFSALQQYPLPPEVVVLIVPRHPTRFTTVFQLCQQQGYPTIRRSDGMTQESLHHARIIVGDSMGEMAAYLAWADMAFIGGSFAPLGGQNLLEAIAQKIPVVVGPHTFNFATATADAIDAGLATRVPDYASALRYAYDFLDQATQTQTKQTLAFEALATHFMTQHQGASAKTLQHLRPYIGILKDTSRNLDFADEA